MQHSANGKYFARVKTIETLNTRKMANHIAEHGSIYTPDVIFGVLEKFRSCLKIRSAMPHGLFKYLPYPFPTKEGKLRRGRIK